MEVGTKRMNGLELRFELERLHGESYGWASCCCGRNAGLADDVLQVVYLKVLGGNARYAGRSTFKTWLFSVIRRTAIDERRRRLRHRLLLQRYSPAVACVDSPETAASRSEAAEAFRAALASLPARQQQVLHLVFYHDLTVSAAAEVMGVSLGSARTHYDRAKRKMRDRLSEKNYAIGPGRAATPGVVL